MDIHPAAVHSSASPTQMVSTSSARPCISTARRQAPSCVDKFEPVSRDDTANYAEKVNRPEIAGGHLA